MNMLESIENISVVDKRVLVRVDYNVPLSNGIIKDDTRIRESLPTIRYLLENNAVIILCSHLGRPKGKINPELSLKPVADLLSELLDEEVIFVDKIGDQEMRDTIDSKDSDNQIFLLENTRFHPGEEDNSLEFSKYLASLADIFVSDAFGAVHRAHASTRGVTRFIPGYAGFLVLKEYARITKAMEDPSSPAVALFGGAKISTKLEVLENFVGKADTIVLGGGMANTFLLAQGHNIGKSLAENDMIDTAKTIVQKIEEAGMELIVPSDVRVAKSFDEPWLENNIAKVFSVDEVPNEAMILDIGPNTEVKIAEKILQANTITWNGPMGVFEKDHYKTGTMNVARAIVNRKVETVIGGGETAYAMNLLEIEIPDAIHISTGGGASLELMSGAELPGLTCLTGKITTE